MSGVCSSDADEGTLGLLESTVAMFSRRSSISFSSSESLKPIQGFRSLLTVLNWMIPSYPVAGLRTKHFLVPSVWISVFSSYSERVGRTVVFRSCRSWSPLISLYTPTGKILHVEPVYLKVHRNSFLWDEQVRKSFPMVTLLIQGANFVHNFIKCSSPSSSTFRTNGFLVDRDCLWVPGCNFLSFWSRLHSLESLKWF